jgi:6-methylsalicylate decarboxylase
MSANPENDASLCSRGGSRREFLKSAAVVGASALMPASGWLAQLARSPSGPQDGIIDVHSHFSTPSLIQALGTQRLGTMASWTAAKALEDMDGSGVSTAMASIPPTGDPFLDASKAVRLSRDCNEFAARLAADHPGRFGVFAATPLPNIDATLNEIEYALDSLKADGIALFTSYGDKWLGDPAFNPVFEELNRRRVVVYTHPNTANCCRNLLTNVSDATIEWGTDTTRAITQVIFGGAAARYPNIHIIWSHAGGTMPYLVERFNLMAKTPQFASKFPDGFPAAAAKFYYDTAQTSNPAAMSALRKVVPVTQIVYGTDYPFRTEADHVKGLKDCGVFSADDLRLVERENILPLLPRFKG